MFGVLVLCTMLIKVTGYSLSLIFMKNITLCRIQLQHAIEATYNSTMSTF